MAKTVSFPRVAERALIVGLSGPLLTPDERDFFADLNPWGFILFSRNVSSPEQMRRLTGNLRDTVGRDAPILIDQEGGRVARMKEPHWQEWAPVRDVCDGMSNEIALMRALRLRYRIIALELREVGVDVNCVPLVDVPQLNAHPVIGNRALGVKPMEVAIRAREVASGTLEGGCLPVIKHLPGHGRALHDTHENMTRVTASVEELRRVDFPPFLALRDVALGMTAHVIFDAIDPKACATHSPAVIDIVRGELGFDGLLMTDDISMKALDLPMHLRVRRALHAGCDVILHCNGNSSEMKAIAEEAPELQGAALQRAEHALAQRGRPRDGKIADLRAIHDGLLKEMTHV
ncbi:MAG: glycoside hydrolase family 3 N-terminal domain-containing protein [Pseudomonadota bacterium]